jgi:dGTPase
MEDAQRLKILSSNIVEQLLLNLIEELGHNTQDINRVNKTLKEIDDRNERISYLRAKSINALTQQSAIVFTEQSSNILSGEFNGSLVGSLYNNCSSLREIEKVSVEEIYNHDTVIEIEIAGYNVMSELLKLFITASLKVKPVGRDEKILRLIPKQFAIAKASTPYHKAIAVLDFVSGMTDIYATELYKKVFGIETPKHG